MAPGTRGQKGKAPEDGSQPSGTPGESEAASQGVILGEDAGSVLEQLVQNPVGSGSDPPVEPPTLSTGGIGINPGSVSHGPGEGEQVRGRDPGSSSQLVGSGHDGSSGPSHDASREVVTPGTAPGPSQGVPPVKEQQPAGAENSIELALLRQRVSELEEGLRRQGAHKDLGTIGAGSSKPAPPLTLGNVQLVFTFAPASGSMPTASVETPAMEGQGMPKPPA